MSRTCAATLTVLLTLSLFTAKAQQPNPPPLPASRDYASILKGCGQDGSGRIHFFSAFGALWPIPSNFVLLDSAKQQLEYFDGAFPWSHVRSTSTVFFGPHAAMEERWGWLISRAGKSQPALCSLEVKKYENVPEFGNTAVIVTGRYDHLLLVGPIAEAVSSAMECHALTKRQVGGPC